jgi:hypothetical protein
LLLLVGDGLCATSLCATCRALPPSLSSFDMHYGLSPHAEPEAFYGFYGNAFNCSRQAPPHEAYAIVQNWVQRRFTGTAADAAMQQALKEALRKPPPPRAAEAPMASPSEEARASAEAVPASGWQAQSALRAWGQAGPKGLLDLTGSINDADRDADENDGDGDGGHESSGNDDDDEAAANRPFDAHAPDLPGAFHIFTSVADGDFHLRFSLLGAVMTQPQGFFRA